jgi:hypothetical protein
MDAIKARTNNACEIACNYKDIPGEPLVEVRLPDGRIGHIPQGCCGKCGSACRFYAIYNPNGQEGQLFQ